MDDKRYIVVAPNHLWMRDWCRDKDLNPNGRQIIALTSWGDDCKIKGIQANDDVELVILGWPNDSHTSEEIYRSLKLAGFKVA